MSTPPTPPNHEVNVVTTAVGTLILAARLIERLHLKGLLSEAEVYQILRDSLSQVGPDQRDEVRETFKRLWPGAPI